MAGHCHAAKSLCRAFVHILAAYPSVLGSNVLIEVDNDPQYVKFDGTGSPRLARYFLGVGLL